MLTMTPHSPPFGHPDPYQPTPSPAVYNHLVHSAQRYGSSRQDYPHTHAYTNTDIPTVIYPQRYNHSGYTCSLLNSKHTQLILILWIINGNSRDAMKIQISPSDCGIHQHSHPHADIQEVQSYIWNKNLFGSSIRFLHNLPSCGLFSLRLCGQYYPTTHTRPCAFNPLSAKITKWSNTLKQFVGNMPTNCLSVFDYFVKLALKGLTKVCLNPSLFCFIIHTPLWSAPLMNSKPIFTAPYPT